MASTRATPYSLLTDFERRALAHQAQAPSTQEGGRTLWRGLCFDVRGIEMVASINEVAEILVMPNLTYVPGAKPWLRGIANLRGALLTVIDFKHFLFGEVTEHEDSNRVLVVRQRGAAATGLLVSSVLGQRGFEETAAVVPDEVVDPHVLPYVTHAYGDAAGKRYWPVLSLPTLLRAQAFLDAAA